MTVFEDLGNEHVMIEGCPCGSHHGRNEFEDTDETVKAGSAVRKVYLCPNGRQVYLSFKEIDLGKSNEPVYELIEVEDAR